MRLFVWVVVGVVTGLTVCLAPIRGPCDRSRVLKVVDTKSKCNGVSSW